MKDWIARGVTAALLGFGLAISGPANAFDAKVVTVMVGYGAGGGYDAAGRLVSRHIGRFLPGNPEVIVENVPGGGSMRLTQLLLGAEPSDGSVIGIIGPGLAYAPLFDPANAQYDPLELGWIGTLSQGENMCTFARPTGIDSVEKFVGADALVGASGKSSSTYVLAALARHSLGAKFRIITGFDGKADITLAMQRGEIAGFCVASSGDLAANNLKDEVNVLVRFGTTDIKGYEDVPRLQDLIADPQTKAAAELVEFSVQYDQPLVLPAGASDDLLATYRQAFDAMVLDPEFLKDAATVSDLILMPTPGETLEGIMREKYALDMVVIEAARALTR